MAKLINGTIDIGNELIRQTKELNRNLQNGGGGSSSSVTVTNFPATQTVAGNVGVTGEVEIKNDNGNPIPVTGSVSLTGTPTVNLGALNGAATQATLAQVDSKLNNRTIYTTVVDKISYKQYIMRQFYDATGAMTSQDFIDFTTNATAPINPADVIVDTNANKTMSCVLSANADLVNLNDLLVFQDIGALYNVGIIKFRSNINETAAIKLNGWNPSDGNFYNIPFEIVKHIDESNTYNTVLYFNIQGFDRIEVQVIEQPVAGGYLDATMVVNTVNRNVESNTLDPSTKQIDISKFGTNYTNHPFLKEGQYTNEQILKTLLSFIGGQDDTTILRELVSIDNKILPSGISINSGSSPVVISSEQTQDLMTTHTATNILGENLFVNGSGAFSFDTLSNGTSYREFAIQIISAAGTLGGAIIFEGSNDNFATTAIPLSVFDDTTNTGVVLSGAQTITQNTTRYFVGETAYRYVRCRVSTAPTGTSTLRAITKWGIVPSTHRTVVVAQPTATNLQATATININGTALQNTATPAATTTVRALPTANIVLTTNADAVSLARTASGNSGTVADDYGNTIASVINVTATSGTGQTMDIALEQSSDGGATWQAIYHLRRITGAGAITVPKMTINGRRRWSWVIAGTTPSFTFSITSSRPQVNADTIRNFFDRTITATLNATSAAFDIEETKCTVFYINSGAATTPGSFQLQVSNDASVWANAGSPVASVASTMVTSGGIPVNAKFARIICTSAGTTQTINYVNINSIS